MYVILHRTYNIDDDVVRVEIVGLARDAKATYELIAHDFLYRYDDDTYKAAALAKLVELLDSGSDGITVPVETRLGRFIVNDYFIEQHTPK
jgi:hypothetical protein